MSAWLCSQDHINLIVNASDDPNEETFKLLLEENLNSLRYRYRYAKSDFLQDCDVAAKSYQFERIAPIDLIQRVYAERRDLANRHPVVTQEITLDRVRAQVRLSCDSFDYQSCEHPEWEMSKAAAIVHGIMNNTPANEQLEDEALWSF